MCLRSCLAQSVRTRTHCQDWCSTGHAGLLFPALFSEGTLGNQRRPLKLNYQPKNERAGSPKLMIMAEHFAAQVLPWTKIPKTGTVESLSLVVPARKCDQRAYSQEHPNQKIWRVYRTGASENDESRNCEWSNSILLSLASPTCCLCMQVIEPVVWPCCGRGSK